MHEAYKIHSLVTLTSQIESIAAYGDNLLVGTRQGHLFMYSLVQNEDKCIVELMRYNKTFSKKAVQQIEVIPDCNLLVSLTDNLIQLHDINATNFATLHQIQKSKGATIFAINIQKPKSLTGTTSTLVRLAVAVKRKLQLYYLKNNEFLQLIDDITLIDVPRSIVWCEETICVGYKGEYCLLKLGGEQIDLFPTSSSWSSEPCIVKVSEKSFALCRESQTVLVNTQGQTENTRALKWSNIPLTLTWDEPYALGVFPESIEVQTLEPSGIVQILNIAKVQIITTCRQGLVFAASDNQLWCIEGVSVSKQRKVLLDLKQFQLALKLTEISNEIEDDKREKIHQIQTLLAYDLFYNKRFYESMKEFLTLETDPYEVIRLFPDLLPQQSGTSTHLHPSNDLTEKELETGLLALIDYLTEMRHRLPSGIIGNDNASGNLNEKNLYNKSTLQLLQIIDTTLLKCYLQTNDALVAPLLRLNHCHLGETEKILKKMGKHNELIILYQTKGQHRRALELLQKEQGLERTISYLQHLGSENMGLIIEFANWVLTAAPEEGLKIFTEDVSEVELLPRPRILDFLLRSHSYVVIPYLEHVVHIWEDTNPLFHNALIHQYREKIISEGPAVAQHTRKKLIEFLKKSMHYTADTVLGHFPTDNLLEERGIILGRLGRHGQSLEIYVRVLGDIPKAVKYAEEVYEMGGPASRNIYASLIKLLLNPASSLLSLPGSLLSPKTAQPDLELALDLLREHAFKMDPLEVISILPDNVPAARIQKFLLVAFHKVVKGRRRVQLMKGLLYAEHLQCQEMRLHSQRQHVLVTDMNVCPVCKKRFGNQSALVRYPNGDIVHYSCHEKHLGFELKRN